METTVAQKLEALAKLQSIDSKLDEIRKTRGDLPEEVRDLEDELAGYEARVKRFETEIQKLEEDITTLKNNAKESEKLIKKYAEQQKNVRNNREFEAISKEMELQQLEIQVCIKKAKEAQIRIETKNEEITNTKKVLSERKKDLKTKKEELEVIVEESKDEETKLMKEREKASSSIEERMVISYNKIRGNAVNGLAVVPVRRDACGGCFNTVPPQKQVEIREKKKLIVCEHCGRIFSHVETNVTMEMLKKA